MDITESTAHVPDQSAGLALLIPHQAVDPSLADSCAWERIPPVFESSEFLEQQRFDTGGTHNIGFPGGPTEQVMDLLSMNWMSPEYSNPVDWNTLLASTSQVNIDPNMATFPFSFQTQPTSAPNIVETWLPMDGRSQAPNSKEAGDRSGMQPPVSTGPALYQGSIGENSVSGSRRTDSTEASCYVDGDESRAPFRGQSTQQRLRRAVQSPGYASGMSTNSVTLPNKNLPLLGLVTLVTETSYNNMIQNVCVGLSESLVAFDPAQLPSQQRITDAVRLYFDNFHPVFPFLRIHDFASQTATHWILLLAVAAVGEKFIRNPPERSSGEGLVEILETICSRLIPNMHRGNNASSLAPLHSMDNGHFDLPTLQAVILNLICIIHSGKKALVKRAFVKKHYLIAGCIEMCLLSSPREEDSAPHGEEHTSEAGVQEWLTQQSRNRTGLMIWLVDFMIAYEFDSAPLLQLVDARCTLPCHNDAWESPSPERVATARSNAVTLLDAVEMLYIEKRMPENLTEFSINLLIHAILRRSKEVIRQSRTRLASWTPTAEIQSRTPQQKGSGETWPPATPLLSKWRNSACDCLDILHWHENGKAARAAGCEQPTIMYLHLSRLVLLTPMVQIQALASTVDPSAGTPSGKYNEARSQVLQWAIHDAFKARLSIVHAGAVFWHTRRYSSGGFLEPFAIYSATLSVWAYSVCLQFARQQAELLRQRSATHLEQMSTTAHQHSGSNNNPSSLDSSTPHFDVQSTPRTEPEEPPDPSFIHLDRPCDDEMVQMFLRRGDQMSAYMSRVGNIADGAAPRKIVMEGIRLLQGEPSSCGRSPLENRDNERNLSAAGRWGIEDSFLEVLHNLAQTMEQGGLNAR